MSYSNLPLSVTNPNLAAGILLGVCDAPCGDLEIDALIKDIESAYPSINWKPAHEAIETEAESLGVEYVNMTRRQIRQISDEASCFLSEEDAEKYDAIIEALEVAA